MMRRAQASAGVLALLLSVVVVNPSYAAPEERPAELASGIRSQAVDVTVTVEPAASRDTYSAASAAQVRYSVASSYGSIPFGLTGGLSVWPAPGGINDVYGYRDDGHGGSEWHGGIDIMAPGGSAVVAAAAGVVTEVGSDGTGWGYYVVVDHGGGLSTLYAHFRAGSTAVALGQQVAAGTLLGLVGDTGYATAEHLHFEVRIGSERVNPMAYVVQ